MVTAQRLLTADEFWHLPDPADGGKIELVAGRVQRMAPVGRRHGRTAARLLQAIGPFVRLHKLGETGAEAGFRISAHPDTVLAPDCYFVSWERLENSDEDGFIVGVPDLAVEVTSPDDTEPEVAAKVARYLEAGTPRVWVMRPKTKRVSVHFEDGSVSVCGAGQKLSSHEAGFAVPGFEVTVDELFE